MIGNIVKVVVDRPLGSYHPKHKDIYYPINYGYIEEIMEQVHFQEKYFRSEVRV